MVREPQDETSNYAPDGGEMAEAQQTKPGTDRDSTRSESSEELCARMQAVLSWIANGDRTRFDDYARVAGQTAEEAKAALSQRKEDRNGNDAKATDGGYEGDSPGAVVSIRRPGTRDPSFASARP